MSDLVGNTEDRFSPVAAHLKLTSAFRFVVAAAWAINMDLIFAFGLVPGLMMLGFFDFFLSPSFFPGECVLAIVHTKSN